MSQKKTFKSSSNKIVGGLFVLLAAGTVVPFQNCSQVEFMSQEALKVEVLSTPGSEIVRAGNEENFPPLKLVFVVDNSHTMKANQINLSSAFSSMFNGDNASNLSPFDTTAYVISTAQKSLPQNSPIWAKLPQNAPSALSNYSIAQLASMRGTTTTDGALPGDLVGYGVEETMASGLRTVNFHPAPVVDFWPENGKVGIGLGVRKQRDGSVSAFANDFAARLAVLDPNRPNVDPTTNTVPLDAVVDHESGLCALARVLKRNDGLLNKGDLAAFVVVSDEEDADPAGRACVDRYVDYLDSQDLVDGQCKQAYTKLFYKPRNTNQANATCTVSFRTGFPYRYDYLMPRTKLSYYRWLHKYDKPRVDVTYHTYQHTYDIPKTKVEYYTSSPTYDLKQTSVEYYKEERKCVIRDGLESDCVISYPKQTPVILAGDYSRTSCDAFVAGKLPSGALYNNASYKPKCAPGPMKPQVGACPTSNPDATNCQPNYSAVASTILSGVPSDFANQSACDAFVAGKLPANAVYVDAGKKPKCLDATQQDIVTAGQCPASGKADCKNITPLKAGSPAKIYAVMGSDCSQLVSGKLPANAVYDSNSAYKPVCNPTSEFIQNVTGQCPTTADPMKANCQTYASAQLSLAVDGAPSSPSQCAAFAAPMISYEIEGNTTYPITCTADTAASRYVTGEIKFSSLPSGLSSTYDPAVGADCSPELIDVIKTAKSVSINPSSCKITALATSHTATQTLSAACSTASVANVCSSSSPVNSKRGCAGTDNAAGAEYLAETSQRSKGTFTCESTCQEAGLSCTGLVKDNYKDCRVEDGGMDVAKNFAGELATKPDICADGQVKVVTKGPYKQQGLRTEYVAGQYSENSDSAALAKYIVERSAQLFGASTPSVSVFVKQPKDTSSIGTVGSNYNALAAALQGQTMSVFSGPEDYSSSLKMLAGKVREQLNRSFNIAIGENQSIVRAYYRKAGERNWGEPLSESLWSASGGTVTLDPSLQFSYGDEFKFDYE